MHIRGLATRRLNFTLNLPAGVVKDVPQHHAGAFASE
jgi:hypothetical protein